jgi:hypothetical protein
MVISITSSSDTDVRRGVFDLPARLHPGAYRLLPSGNPRRSGGGRGRVFEIEWYWGKLFTFEFSGVYEIEMRSRDRLGFEREEEFCGYGCL